MLAVIQAQGISGCHLPSSLLVGLAGTVGDLLLHVAVDVVARLLDTRGEG